ncbi:MAG: UDP-N-acetylmuramate--L-alanine ligase [Ktedonobacteraceae bacterium]
MNKPRLHFMGIGGQGISAVAQMVLEAERDNVIVTGCDMQASATTQALQRVGVPVQIGHSADHLADIDKLVVVPAALVLNPNHPELATARSCGIPMITWQEMLGELMRNKCVLSVSGVHGKGTTTAMLSLILVDAGLDPTCEVGAIVPRFGYNYRLGKSPYFVNEADEFYNNFWNYHPRVAIVTSVEFEHPEFFTDYAEFLASFEHFVRGMDIERNWPVPPTLILNVDSPGCLELLARLQNWPGRLVTYTVAGLSIDQKDSARASTKNRQAVFEEAAQSTSRSDVTNAKFMPSSLNSSLAYEAYDVQLEGETSFRVRVESGQQAKGFSEDISIRLQLPGAHNVQNALAAFTAASVMGIDTNTIVKTLESFSGIRRRFEIRNQDPIQINGQALDVILVDDYAHHPTAIAATLEAAHRRYPTRRLVAVYQPHMYSRTKTFFKQFLHSFDIADVAIIADIFPARERDTGLISAKELAEAVARQLHFQQHGQVIHGGSIQATTQLLRNILHNNDLVLIMGAGDIYTLTDMLLEERNN